MSEIRKGDRVQRCAFCTASLYTSDAIEAGWDAYFWYLLNGKECEHAHSCCPDCWAKYLKADPLNRGDGDQYDDAKGPMPPTPPLYEVGELVPFAVEAVGGWLTGWGRVKSRAVLEPNPHPSEDALRFKWVYELGDLEPDTDRHQLHRHNGHFSVNESEIGRLLEEPAHDNPVMAWHLSRSI